MSSSKPQLDVWDTCCILGILNNEADKVPALLAQTRFFESGGALLGIPSCAVSEIVTLADGTSASSPLEEFLNNPYVQLLQPTREVSILSGRLQFRFNPKQISDLREKAIAAGVPKDNANKLTSRDSEILATALVFKAERLSTYDPFLLFLGREYLQKETGLLICQPASTLLPFPEPTK
jgi:hypothetical protein